MTCLHPARTVRTSSLQNISLRHNKISATGGGAVSLALMTRDYPDAVPAPNVATPGTPLSSPASSLFMSPPPSPHPSVTNIMPPPTRMGPIPPPPRRPALAPQTAYTSYIPRSKCVVETASKPALCGWPACPDHHLQLARWRDNTTSSTWSHIDRRGWYKCWTT